MPARSKKASARVGHAKKPKPRKPSVARRAGAPQRTGERIGALVQAQTVPADALALLAQDHREAEALFAQFEDGGPAEVRARLAGQICLALTVHATREEQGFY